MLFCSHTSVWPLQIQASCPIDRRQLMSQLLPRPRLKGRRLPAFAHSHQPSFPLGLPIVRVTKGCAHQRREREPSSLPRAQTAVRWPRSSSAPARTYDMERRAQHCAALSTGLLLGLLLLLAAPPAARAQLRVQLPCERITGEWIALAVDTLHCLGNTECGCCSRLPARAPKSGSAGRRRTCPPVNQSFHLSSLQASETVLSAWPATAAACGELQGGLGGRSTAAPGRAEPPAGYRAAGSCSELPNCRHLLPGAPTATCQCGARRAS